MSFTCVRPKIHSCIIGYVRVYIFCLIRDDCVVCLMHIQYSHKEMKNATLIFSYPGHFLYRCKSCSNACKACRYLDRWPTRLTPRVYLCSDGTYHGFQDTSVCLFQCKWWISVCAQVCVGEKKKKIWKLHFYFWCHAGYKWALGPSDQPLHQFTARLEVLLLLSFSPTSSPSLALCYISALWLLFFSSFAAFLPALGWTLGDVNESHVLCDFCTSLCSRAAGQRNMGDNSPLHWKTGEKWRGVKSG